MGDTVQCVFIPPSFNFHEILSFTIYSDAHFSEIPPLIVQIDEKQFEINKITNSDNKITWNCEKLVELKEHRTKTKEFKVKFNDLEKTIDLNGLIFLGMPRSFKPIYDVLLLEFKSGYYCRSDAISEDPVSFNVDFILTLDYRNVVQVKAQIEELQQSQKSFIETKERLVQTGLNLKELSDLKVQYEECMKEKRRVQHDFIDQNQKMQAATIITTNDEGRSALKEQLTKHIQANKERITTSKPDIEAYEKMKEYRLMALQEMLLIFPLGDNNKFCYMNYYQTPANLQQFNEMRAYLGYATHYIRELSRILGIPLPFVLYPQAAASKITSRLIEKSVAIPADFNVPNIKIMQSYEQILVDCSKHILNSLLMESEGEANIPVFIEKLTHIDDTALSSLIPTLS